MRTNIVLDDNLIKKGFKLTEAKTKKELVNLALEELIKRKQRKQILKLEGKVKWQGNLKKLRKGRFDTG
ncbi:hypothetical protein LCGC14_1182860 [marine sediment metagenome]|uniref:Transcription regulator of the Arc/MetJ class n=1 Tax=marine sediment metagenome TaxID=412755 RepID=A0A0F9LLQ3_9ZZZZ